MPTEVEVYSIVNCPFCMRAKALLRSKGVEFVDHDLTDMPTPDLREMMVRLCGRRTVPQIIIGGQHIGGCDELHELDASGDLDPLLGRE